MLIRTSESKKKKKREPIDKQTSLWRTSQKPPGLDLRVMLSSAGSNLPCLEDKLALFLGRDPLHFLEFDQDLLKVLGDFLLLEFFL